MNAEQLDAKLREAEAKIASLLVRIARLEAVIDHVASTLEGDVRAKP